MNVWSGFQNISSKAPEKLQGQQVGVWTDRKPRLGRDPDNPGKKQVFIFNPDAENFVLLFTLSEDIQSQDTVSQVVSDFMYFR